VSRATNLLLTGRPGVGKTTVIQKVAIRLHDRRIAGFVTEEVRDSAGHRTGFRAITLDGARSTIADMARAGPPRISKYGVDVAAIDRLAEEALRLDDDVDVYLIDEIGKMECLSEVFVEAVERLLDSAAPVVATIGQKGPGLIASAKRRPDVELWEVTESHRAEMPDRILAWLEGED
jgi:nucleoside-triphosphatase